MPLCLAAHRRAVASAVIASLKEPALGVSVGSTREQPNINFRTEEQDARQDPPSRQFVAPVLRLRRGDGEIVFDIMHDVSATTTQHSTAKVFHKISICTR